MNQVLIYNFYNTLQQTLYVSMKNSLFQILSGCDTKQAALRLNYVGQG